MRSWQSCDDLQVQGSEHSDHTLGSSHKDAVLISCQTTGIGHVDINPALQVTISVDLYGMATQKNLACQFTRYYLCVAAVTENYHVVFFLSYCIY